MNPTERMMLHLLDCALRGRTPDPALAEGVNWETLFQLAQEHKIDALLLDPICLLPQEAQPHPGILAIWQDNAMHTMVSQAMLVSRLFELLDAMDAGGVQVVVLKGAALKGLYPQPDLRTMSDADLLAAPGQIKAARTIMETTGFTLTKEEPGVFIYRSGESLLVELHQQLFDKTSYGFLSRLDEAAMFPVSLARREEIYGGEAWVFPPMQHAMFMLCHMAKHMITTGFGLRQTADFVLFTEANDDVMDWAAFWAQAELLGLASFASALLELGVQYLSLQRGKWSQGAISDPAAAEGLLLDLLDAGVFGNRTEERKRSAAVVYRAYETKDASSGRIHRAIFPSANSLKAPYLYARRHPALLPIAWVHRWVNYGVSLITGKARVQDASAGLQVADERLRLLDRLGLRDDTPEE